MRKPNKPREQVGRVDFGHELSAADAAFAARVDREKAARARAGKARRSGDYPSAIVDGEVWTQVGATLQDENGLAVAQFAAVADAEAVIRALQVAQEAPE